MKELPRIGELVELQIPDGVILGRREPTYYPNREWVWVIYNFLQVIPPPSVITMNVYPVYADDFGIEPTGWKSIGASKMAVIKSRPPNFDQIVRILPSAGRSSAIFCYGNIIHNPSGFAIPKALLNHEQVHSNRQFAMGVDLWWDRYLDDIKFRFDEELAAHVAEYQTYLNLPRKHRQYYLKTIAKKLSSNLYGVMVTYEQAKKLIKQ